jgi:hypothetical protein
MRGMGWWSSRSDEEWRLVAGSGNYNGELRRYPFLVGWRRQIILQFNCGALWLANNCSAREAGGSAAWTLKVFVGGKCSLIKESESTSKLVSNFITSGHPCQNQSFRWNTEAFLSSDSKEQITANERSQDSMAYSWRIWHTWLGARGQQYLSHLMKLINTSSKFRSAWAA